MADNRYQIGDEREAAGRFIMEMVEGVGFEAYAAGWLHDRPTKAWRYVLSTPMMKSKGPLWIYERLLRVFRHKPLPEGISPLDIFVIDPDLEMSLFGDLIMSDGFYVNGKRQTPSSIMISIDQEIRIEGLSITDGFAHFFKRTPVPLRKRKGDPVRSFDRKVRMLEAA